MNTIFSAPDIRGNFENMVHKWGSFLPVNERLLTVQENIIAQWFQFTGERREEFVNIEGAPVTELQAELQIVLREITDAVAADVLRITGKTVSMDPWLSAIWIENKTSPMNLIVHRDASEAEIVRATCSIAPTRFLPSDVMIPIDEKEWDKRHYPMGPALLPWMEAMTTTGELWSVGIMAGTTYHRGPAEEEIFRDFTKAYGDKGLKQGHIPRIFASIWGRIPK